MAANAYSYAAGKGKQAARSTAVKDATTMFMDQYSKAQDIQMKRQQMIADAQKSQTADPLKQFAQMAAMAEQGLISPDVMRAVSPYANATVMQSLGIQPQYAPQVQAQAPMVGGQPFGAGVAPQQAPNYGANLTPEQQVKLSGEQAKQQALMPGNVQEAEQKQISKEATDTSINTERLMASSANVTSSFLDFADELNKKTGLKPGFFGGLATKVSPNDMNKMKEQFRGAQMENAAQVAATSIPGARAARVVDMFQNDAPSEFSTIESGVNNSKRSLMGAVIKDAMANPTEYGIAPNLNKSDRVKAAEKIANDIGNQFYEDFIVKVYDKNKNLFKEDSTREKAKQLWTKMNKINQEFSSIDADLFGG